MMYAWAGAYDSAIITYSKALRVDSNYTQALNNRALVYYYQGLNELAIKDYLRAMLLDTDDSRVIINLILAYLASDQLDKASAQYDMYREKKLKGFVESVKAFNFLTKYITACTDYIRIKDYKKALPLLQASIEEYKQSNQDQNTNQMLAYEYSNVMYRTAWVLEQLMEDEKAIDYYKKAQIINPKLTGVTARVDKLTTKMKEANNRAQTPPQLQLLTPSIVSGNVVQKENAGGGQLFISGIAKDPAGISWVKVNGSDVPGVKDDGYFAVTIKADATNLTIQSANKNGAIASANYTLKEQTQNNSTDDPVIQPIPAEIKPVFHAVLIANSNYGGKWNKLPTTIAEAQLYKKLLTNYYGFNAENILELYDKGYVELLSGLSAKLESLTENDNLVIMYAGHGTYKKAGTELIGYWVPLNANAPEIDYVSNKKLDEIISGCKAKHILMISDACYSAAMRGGNEDESAVPQKYEYKFKSRQMLTSGGLEKVPGESIFIKMVMKALEENQEKYLSAKVLYNLIFSGVRNQTSKEPELNLFGKDGNEGGQFYFIKAK
jgi:tetratricopeptide (TPR) repeat protein